MRNRIAMLGMVAVAAGACGSKQPPSLPQPNPVPSPAVGAPQGTDAIPGALLAQLRKPRGTSLREGLQWKVDSLVAASNIPGVVVGVSLYDGTTFAIAGGWADSVKHIRMRPDSRMLLGSVGKTYFSAAALTLVDDGKLDLDAPISKYLGDEPWFNRVPNAKDITVRMLMNHTSGLVRYEFNPKVTDAITQFPDKEFTPAERVSYILDTAAPFAAGQGWLYSDTNYIMLGMIVEKITDGEYYKLIRRRILNPLNLTNTIPSDSRKLVGVVQGYAGPDNPFGGKDEMWEDGRMIMNPQMEWAGGGFASTADDLALWARNLYGGNILSDGMKKQLFTTVAAPALGRGVGYGLGVISAPTDLGQSWGHSGFFPGYLAEVRYYPEFDFAVSILFNTSVSRSLGKSPSTLLQDMARTVAVSQKRRGS